MSRNDKHDGISCDVCSRSNFRGKRYKCLVCNDYDLCAACYENGGVTLQHLPMHPMQVILTRNDFELYFGGETVARDRAQSFTCVACGRTGLTDAALYEHVRTAHGDRPISRSNCPLCVMSRRGDPRKPDDLLVHLAVEHRLASSASAAPEDRHAGSGASRHVPPPSAAAAAGSFMRRRIGGPSQASQQPQPNAADREAQAERDALAELLAQLEGRVTGSRAELLNQRMEQSIFEQLERRQLEAARAVPAALQPVVLNSRQTTVPAGGQPPQSAAASETPTSRQQDTRDSYFLLTSVIRPSTPPSTPASMLQSIETAQFVLTALYDSLIHEPSLQELCLVEGRNRGLVQQIPDGDRQATEEPGGSPSLGSSKREDAQQSGVMDAPLTANRLQALADSDSAARIHHEPATVPLYDAIDPVFSPAATPTPVVVPTKQRFVTKAMRVVPRKSERDVRETSAVGGSEADEDDEADETSIVRPPFLD